MSEEFKATSGAKVVINPADTESVFALKDSIQRAALGSNAEINFSGDITGQDIDIQSIAKIAMTVDSDPIVRKTLFDCLGRCTRNGERIALSTFDDPKAREDYYEIAIACIKVNLSPFFAPLLSKFGPLVQKTLKEAGAEKKEDPAST